MSQEFIASKLDDILMLFQDYKVEKHTDDEKGYEFLDVGQYFIIIKNPEGENNLSIKLGKEFTLFFGGWHFEYTANEEGYRALIETMRTIIDCSKCVYRLKFENKSIFALGKVVTGSSTGCKAPKNILEGIEQFKKVKVRNAKLRLVSWQTEYNREFCF